MERFLRLGQDGRGGVRQGRLLRATDVPGQSDGHAERGDRTRAIALRQPNAPLDRTGQLAQYKRMLQIAFGIGQNSRVTRSYSQTRRNCLTFGWLDAAGLYNIFHRSPVLYQSNGENDRRTEKQTKYSLLKMETSNNRFILVSV